MFELLKIKVAWVSFLYYIHSMKTLIIILISGACALSSSVMNANNASPTGKTKIALIEDLAVMEANSLALEIQKLKAYEGGDLIAGAPLEIGYMPKAGDAEYKMPSKLKNKYHPWYLFNPLKIC